MPGRNKGLYCFLIELLRDGSTTGQAVRASITPVKEEKSDTASDVFEKSQSDGGSRNNSQDSDASVAHVMDRQKFNLVCYGLPNIIVAQLTKV